MRLHFNAALGALAVTICGCNGLVVDGLESGREDVDSEGTNAIAMHVDQWLSVVHPSLDFSPCIVVDIDPDDLVLVFSSEPRTCSEPVIDFDPSTTPAECAEQAFWQYVLFIPSELVQPGRIDLSNTDIGLYAAVWKPNCSGGYSCTKSRPGTLEITSIDAGSISMTLDVSPPPARFDPSGDYVASFCP